MGIGAVLADQLEGTREWTLKLLADVRGDDWFFAPAPGLAHPLWILGHLANSQHLLVHVRCFGRGVLDDAWIAHFPMGGPVPARDEHDYPDVEQVFDVFHDTQELTVAAVRAAGDSVFAEPASGKDGQPHPHYRDKLGAVTHCGRHEAFHAGQLATIRRLLGRTFLR